MHITFCGYSDIVSASSVMENLEKALISFMKESETNHFLFYCGGYGDFDNIASRTVDHIRNIFPDRRIEKIYVTPYPDKEHASNLSEMSKLFDEILYPPIENTPWKFAILKRNEWMIEQSDVVFAYVRHHWGGAQKTLSYAQRKKKKIILI